jgi:tripartite-type tricarboxylate transporter receptor subunit TctC
MVALPETKEKLATQGFEPYFNGPAKTAELVKQDIARFGKIIKEAGIKTEH